MTSRMAWSTSATHCGTVLSQQSKMPWPILLATFAGSGTPAAIRSSVVARAAVGTSVGFAHTGIEAGSDSGVCVSISSAGVIE